MWDNCFSISLAAEAKYPILSVCVLDGEAIYSYYAEDSGHCCDAVIPTSCTEVATAMERDTAYHTNLSHLVLLTSWSPVIVLWSLAELVQIDTTYQGKRFHNKLRVTVDTARNTNIDSTAKWKPCAKLPPLIAWKHLFGLGFIYSVV